MNVYVAGVIGLLGVLLLIAGVHGKGTQLFTALTGSTAPAGAGGTLPPGHVQGHASPGVPNDPGPGGDGRGNVLTGPVVTA